MNKRIFLAMSRRRVSCPLTVQQLWDAVKIIRYKRQVPDIERISRYMRIHNVSEDEVRRQINHCIRDGLLQVIKKVGSKGSKMGVSQEGYKIPEEKLEKDSHDWYCFECHSGGDVICCNSCHRVYHLSCILKDDLPEDDVKNKFTCNVCQRCSNKELTPNIKRSQLNRLLKYTATKMRDRLPVALTDRQPPSNTSYISERFAKQGQVKTPSIDVPSNFKWILNDKDEWRVDYLIYSPVDLQIMVAKAVKKQYESLEEFRADIQTIVHNVVLYHGVHSNMADMARLMLRDCNTDLQEILECWLCYKHCNDKTLRNWFIKPCKPPHDLVYARDKGPYWPAKVVKMNDETVDVKFFGGIHERATVDKSLTRSISVNIHALQVKRTSSWNKACEELKRYQKQLEKLRQETDNFTKPFVDSSSDESDEDLPLPTKTRVNENEDGKEESSDFETENTSGKKYDNDEKKTTSSKKSNTKVATDHTKIKKRDEAKKPLKNRGRPRKPSKSEQQTNSKESDNDEEMCILSSEEVSLLSNGKSKNSKNRGRPPKLSSPLKKPRSSSTSASNDLNSDKFGSPDKDEELSDFASESDPEEDNISSTFEKCQVAPKSNEEEIVSSSSQNLATRSVKTQTKPSDIKEWMKTMEEQFEEEKEQLIAKLREEHEQEIRKLKHAHSVTLSDTKRKQWCVHCENEAIYHCCWNTSYCSPDCQQIHWAADHKRHCRRKR